MRDHHQRPIDSMRELAEQTLRRPQPASQHIRAYAKASRTYETSPDIVARSNAAATMCAIRSLTGYSHAQLLAECETESFRA